MDLASIAAVQDQKVKTDLYKEALSKLIQSPSVQDSRLFLEHLVNSEVPLVVSRPIITQFVESLKEFPSEIQFDTATCTIEILLSRELSFDEQVTTVRELLAVKLEEREEWGEAAKILAAVDVERASRESTDAQKLAHYIRITQLFLEEEDSVSAERFLVKARNLIGEVQDQTLGLLYKACYARIADGKRKFLDAASHYYDLSQHTSAQSAQSVAQLLQAAVTCAILHPASMHRSRMLATLYKDERVADVETVPQFPFLEKMLMERIITKEDVQTFDRMLKEHQRAVLPDGFSVLESAVIQHNIRSIAGMYYNISLPQLAELLALPVERVERLACDMIAEGRLKAHIDQVDNVIYFESGKKQLEQLDEQVKGVCDTVNKVVEKILTLQATPA